MQASDCSYFESCYAVQPQLWWEPRHCNPVRHQQHSNSRNLQERDIAGNSQRGRSQSYNTSGSWEIFGIELWSDVGTPWHLTGRIWGSTRHFKLCFTFPESGLYGWNILGITGRCSLTISVLEWPIVLQVLKPRWNTTRQVGAIHVGSFDRMAFLAPLSYMYNNLSFCCHSCCPTVSKVSSFCAVQISPDIVVATPHCIYRCSKLLAALREWNVEKGALPKICLSRLKTCSRRSLNWSGLVI